MKERYALTRLVPAIDLGRTTTWRYTMAVLTSLGFIALRSLLGLFIGYEAPFDILFVAIALSSFFGGLGPGLASVLTTLALAEYFLVPPLYTIGFENHGWVMSSLLFAISGLVVAVLGELGRTAVLQTAEEGEVQRMSQLQAQVTDERLRIAEEAIAGGIWDWDISTHQGYWSAGYRRLLEFPMDVKPSRENWLQSIHPEDRERIVAIINELFEDQRHYATMEYRILSANRRIRWISSYARVFYDVGGKPRRMVGISLDITGRRLAEEEARNDQTKIRLLMQSARIGDWEWNISDGNLRCSPEFYEVLGLDPAVPATFEKVMSYVHPGDQQRVRDLIEHLRQKPGQDFDYENRFIGPDGVERTVHTRGTVLADEAGKASRLVGITFDVAARPDQLLAS